MSKSFQLMTERSLIRLKQIKTVYFSPFMAYVESFHWLTYILNTNVPPKSSPSSSRFNFHTEHIQLLKYTYPHIANNIYPNTANQENTRVPLTKKSTEKTKQNTNRKTWNHIILSTEYTTIIRSLLWDHKSCLQWNSLCRTKTKFACFLLSWTLTQALSHAVNAPRISSEPTNLI